MAVQLADATLHIFAICAAILTFKLLFMVTFIGVLRRIRGAYISPEDYRFRGRRPGAPDELVERVRRAQNDVENIPLFLAVGLVFALTGGYPTIAWWVFVVFTASRLLHTVFYLAALQPWRSVIFAVGSVALGVMPALLIWRTIR